MRLPYGLRLRVTKWVLKFMLLRVLMALDMNSNKWLTFKDICALTNVEPDFVRMVLLHLVEKEPELLKWRLDEELAEGGPEEVFRQSKPAGLHFVPLFQYYYVPPAPRSNRRRGRTPLKISWPIGQLRPASA